MRKIALLSDTHSYFDDKLVKYINSVDEVWHAGDIGDINVCRAIGKLRPLRAVHGNIDDAVVRKEYPESQVFLCEDMKVLITHIGGYPGKYSVAARKMIEEERPGLFICGHSHILKVMYDEKYKLLHMNPGAAGKHGFHQVKTLLRFAIEGNQVKDLEVIELGKRV